VPLLREVLRHPDFRTGDHDTGFVERYFGPRFTAGAREVG
jgi:hypothetical protein